MNQQQQQMAEPQFSVEGGHLVMFHKEATGLPQVKDANVNDRDRMNDLLAQEKYLTAAYNVAMYEASHDALHQMIRQNFDTCQQLQRQLFNTMFKKGWYKLPVADADSVAMTYNQWQKYQTQFPFPPGKQQQANQTQNQAQGQTVNANPADRKLEQAVAQAMQQASKGQMPTVMGTRSH